MTTSRAFRGRHESPVAQEIRKITLDPEQRGRLYELAAEVARLVCVQDAQYVDDRAAHRALDLAANELGHLLGLPEPEFASLWRGDDTGGVRHTSAQAAPPPPK